MDLGLIKNKRQNKFMSKPLHVLIVDDNKDSIQYLQNTIQSRGHHVDVVTEPVRCVTLCQNIQYDILFIDYHMPNLDGDDIIKIVKSNGTQSKVFVITGDKSKDCIDAFKDIDIDGIVFKPISIDTVHLLINYLENRNTIDKKNAMKLQRLTRGELYFPFLT